jgi:S-adenosylmethionine:tRNA ribosyltransferase-isomerase
MKASDFDYSLPPELIAQQPRRRGSSRLLVLDRKSGEVKHAHIRDLVRLLAPGDCLVVNDSRVIPARLRAVKPDTGAKVELLLFKDLGAGAWQALVRPYRRVQAGTSLQVGRAACKVVSLDGAGRVTVRFASARAAQAAMARSGEPPLPPYIHRPAGTDWRRDRTRYQTVYASAPGSVAAPTAGLHFSRALLAALRRRGVRVARVTLHVGLGTFAPLPDGPLEGHALHAEHYRLSPRCRRAGGRVVACGTTTARVLETAAGPDGRLHPGSGETALFIRPGHRWQAVDALLTNFHLPRSSLLLLACAFGGREKVLAAYAEAVRARYYFYSYGDAMLLL